MTVAKGQRPSLISLRCLLFFFFGGIGSLLPFLSLHAKEVGLTLEEARIVSYAAPLLAFLGPIVAGFLLDQYYSKKRQTDDVKFDTNSCIRFTLSSTILAAAIFYSLLLSVPHVQRLTPRQPRVAFACNGVGAYLVQERCNNELGCYQYPAEKKGEIKLKQCIFDCSLPHLPHFDHLNLTAKSNDIETVNVETSPITTIIPETTEKLHVLKMEPDMDTFFGTDPTIEDDEDDWGSGEQPDDAFLRKRRETHSQEDMNPPHICYGTQMNRMCSVYTSYSAALKVNITVRHSLEDKDHCFYPLGDPFSCRIPDSLENSCKVVCQLENPYVVGSVLLQSQCQETVGDPVLTFYLYLLLRTLGDLFTSVSISLVIGALTATHLKISREFVVAAVSYALFSPIIGYLYSFNVSTITLNYMPPYILAIGIFSGFSVISLLILIFASEMPIGPPNWWTTNKSVRMRHKAEFCGLICVLVLLGMLWGPHYSHVPWHLDGVDGTPAFIGSSLALGAFLSIPFVWKADFIIDYCGYSNLLITAFTFYILRYTGLLLIESPRVLFITGSLEVFTLALMLFSAILYIRYLVPKHLKFTAQALGFSAHFCFGNGLGCLIASFLSPSELEILSMKHNRTVVKSDEDNIKESPYHLLYCSAAIFSAVSAAVYFIIYHCCLKNKCLAPSYRKPAQSQPPLVQDSVANGTYTPLTVITNGRQHQGAYD